MGNLQFIKSVVCIVITVAVFTHCTSKPSQGSEKIQAQLSKEVEAINKQCPQLLSETMRIDSCVLKPNNDLEHYYTIMDTARFDSVKFEKEIVAYVKEMSKNSPEMADIRSYGIETRYTYRAVDGRLLYSFAVVPAKL